MSTKPQPSVRERGILFKGELVRAILAGTKTVTRRLVKLPADTTKVYIDPGGTIFGPGPYVKAARDGDPPMHPRIYCPYGYPGDRLFVKETHGIVFDCRDLPCECEEGAETHRRVVYRATDPNGIAGFCKWDDAETPLAWKPSIFMRRADSRIDLEITEVRVERLQSITEDDAIAEGMQAGFEQQRAAFALKWDAINGKRASWESNPWVWVIRFRRIERARAEEGRAAR